MIKEFLPNLFAVEIEQMPKLLLFRYSSIS